jgi:hypothetical protein
LSVLGIFHPQVTSTATVRYGDETRNALDKILYYKPRKRAKKGISVFGLRELLHEAKY